MGTPMANSILTSLSAQQLRSFYAAGFWRDDTIYSLVRGHAESAPDKFAMRDRLRRVTYRQLAAAADRLAADLHARGLRFGDRVAVWLPSRIETAIAALAASRNGYVCCPSLHRDHTVGEIAALLESTRARALIAEKGYGADAHRHSIFETAATIASLKAIYSLDPLGEAVPPLLWPDTVRTDQAPVRDDANTIVYLAFTSGTTGVPKGVMHSDNTLLANARAFRRTGTSTDRSIIYSLSPLSHNLGFGALVMTLMCRRRIRRARCAARPRARRPHRRDRSDFRDRCSDPCHRPARRIARPRPAQPRPRERLSHFRRRRAAERCGGPHRTWRHSAKRLWHDRSRIA